MEQREGVRGEGRRRLWMRDHGSDSCELKTVVPLGQTDEQQTEQSQAVSLVVGEDVQVICKCSVSCVDAYREAGGYSLRLEDAGCGPVARNGGSESSAGRTAG